MPSISSMFLGLIQGLTEFLPISSSGHLVLASEFLKYSSPGIVFETSVHLATTAVVDVHFRRAIWSLLLGIQKDNAARKYCLKLVMAFSGTAILGYFLMRLQILELMQTSVFSGSMLIITSLFLASARWAKNGLCQQSEWEISWKTAILMGLAQGVSILPGISRSGATIVTGLWLGSSKQSAATFSFLLSVPTILAASVIGISTAAPMSQADVGDVLAGSIMAFIVGYIAIQWLMRWLQNDHIWMFSLYCFPVGLGSIAIWIWV